MSTSEFPEPSQAEPGHAEPNPTGAAAGLTSELAQRRAKTVVLDNSRSVIWMTMGCGIIAVPMGICMMLEGGSLLFPVSAITFRAGLAAAQWILGGFMMCMMLPWAWKWGKRLLGFSVKLDARGVYFNLVPKERPGGMFMAWEQVAAVQQKRVGKIWEYSIVGKDGSWASYSTYTFFRPGHVARMIAKRAGLTIQKS